MDLKMKKRTGIFYVKNPAGVVVMNDGVEIARYGNVDEFVSAHAEGLDAITKLNELLHQSVASQYQP